MARQISKASDRRGLKWANSRSEYKESSMEDLVSDRVTLEKVALLLQQKLQVEEDTVVKRSTLPDDEPTKNTDPKRTNIFWLDDNIVTRSNIVTVAVVNGKFIATVEVA